MTPKLRLEQVWKPDKAVYLQSRLGLSFKLPYKKWAVKGYNETFIMVSNLNYNRNRIYTGIARKITNNFQLELGVMSERFVEDTKNYFIFQVMTMM